MSLRILLVVARQGRMTSYQLPLGVGYVSASLKRAGFEVQVLNPNHSVLELDELLTLEIAKFCPDVIATGGMSFHLDQVREVVSVSRRLAPHAVIVVGGALVSNQPEIAMQALPEADIGVVGEGETSTLELVQALADGRELQGIPGLVLRCADPGRFLQTMKRPIQEDLDAFPWIDFDGLGLDLYAGLHAPGQLAPGLIVDHGTRVMPFLTSRGCPFPCTFCCHTAAGRRYRVRSLDDVFAEIEHAIDRFGIDTVMFYDDLFCLKQQRMDEFCARIKPLRLRWECSIRVEQVVPETLRMMRDAGCICISFGVESMSQPVLDSMKKKTTRAAIDRALGHLYEAGITTWANLIFGDPAETWETATESLEWWEKNRRYDLRTAFIGYHPGSRIYDEALQHGLIRDPLLFLLSGDPEINATAMTDDEYQRLRQHVNRFVCSFGFCGRIDMLESDPGGGCTLDTVCPHCGERNRYGGVWFRANLVSRISCRICNQLYRLPISSRPASSEVLADLVNRINQLIDSDDSARSNANVDAISVLAHQALGIDATRVELWELLIGIADELGDAEKAIDLLRRAIHANPFHPQLFEEIERRLVARGLASEAGLFARQGAHLREVGIDGPRYVS